MFTSFWRICLSLDLVQLNRCVATIHPLKSFAAIQLRQSNFMNELFLMVTKLNLNLHLNLNLINLLLQNYCIRSRVIFHADIINWQNCGWHQYWDCNFILGLHAFCDACNPSTWFGRNLSNLLAAIVHDSIQPQTTEHPIQFQLENRTI